MTREEKWTVMKVLPVTLTDEEQELIVKTLDEMVDNKKSIQDTQVLAGPSIEFYKFHRITSYGIPERSNDGVHWVTEKI